MSGLDSKTHSGGRDVLVASTSTAPFVQQAALAFAEVGRLHSLLGTLVDRPQQSWRRGLRRLAPALSSRVDRALSRRQLDAQLQPAVQTRSRGEWMRLLLGKLDRSGVSADWAWERAQRGFDHWVASRLQAGPGWIYAFETGAEYSFARARELGISRCYEVSAAEHATVNALLKSQRDRHHGSTAYGRRIEAREAQRTAWRQREWDLADRIVMYSHYCLQTYAQAGYDVSRVHVVALAAPPPVDQAQLRPRPSQAPLALLWVGHFSVRKGAHLLLEAWQRAALHPSSRLDVYGGIELPDALMARLPANLYLHGTVPRAELGAAYLAADALLFPSLSDSFGMVVTEALAHGCPVLTTRAAGASELLQDGIDGRVIAADDLPALVELLRWAEGSTALLRQAKPQALATATRRGWPQYRADLRAVLEAI